MLEFKFEFLQVVCNHEHYIPLNLPLDVRGKLTCVSLLSLYWWCLLNSCNIFPRTITEWNKLPKETVTSQSLSIFKSKLF